MRTQLIFVAIVFTSLFRLHTYIRLKSKNIYARIKGTPSRLLHDENIIKHSYYTPLIRRHCEYLSKLNVLFVYTFIYMYIIHMSSYYTFLVHLKIK